MGKTWQRRAIVTLALILSLNSSTAQAQSTSQKTSIEQLVEALAEAYEARALGNLDPRRPYLRRVKIIIEHSLAGDDHKDRFEIGNFRNLAQGEQWLRKRETSENVPFRQTRPLLRCRRGLCTYDFEGGILHNQLYLQQVAYGYRNGRPYIKTIYLLDGD